MSEKLLSFLFLGILLALGYRLGLGLIYGRFFAASRQLQSFWYVPYVAVPAALLLALAWWMGFYRRAGWAELWVTLIILAIVVLTVPASYSCGLGCF